MSTGKRQDGRLFFSDLWDILAYGERSDGLKIKAFAISRPGLPRIEALEARDSVFLHFITSGSCEFYGKELHAGDAFLLAAGKPHTNRISSDYTVIWFDLAGKGAAPLLATFGISQKDHTSYRVNHPDYVKTVLRNAHAYCREHLSDSACVAEGTLLFFLSMLDTGDRVVKETDVMDQAAEFFRDHYYHPLRIESVAQQFFLSEKYFCRRFRERFGVPPQEYLGALRMERARTMLLSTDLSIKEIAAAVGYESPHSFDSIFKKTCGVAPSEYRRKGAPEEPGNP